VIFSKLRVILLDKVEGQEAVEKKRVDRDVGEVVMGEAAEFVETAGIVVEVVAVEIVAVETAVEGATNAETYLDVLRLAFLAYSHNEASQASQASQASYQASASLVSSAASSERMGDGEAFLAFLDQRILLLEALEDQSQTLYEVEVHVLYWDYLRQAIALLDFHDALPYCLFSKRRRHLLGDCRDIAHSLPLLRHLKPQNYQN